MKRKRGRRVKCSVVVQKVNGVFEVISKIGNYKSMSLHNHTKSALDEVRFLLEKKCPPMSIQDYYDRGEISLASGGRG